MKITSLCQTPRSCIVTLRGITQGMVIKMKKPFHQDHALDDLFMILDVPDCYLPKEKYRKHCDDKVGLANLRTGSLSYVLDDKACIIQDVELSTYGDLLCGS